MTPQRLSDLHRRLSMAAADIDHIRDRLERAWAELQAAQPGIRSTPTDSGPRTHHHTDPTANQAASRHHDPAVRALEDLADWIAGIEQRTAWTRTIIDIWTSRPTPAGSGTGDPGCQWMSRHGGPWEEARYSVDGPGGGRLRVGQRTWRWLRDTGELPPKHVIADWSAGRQPRRRTATRPNA